MRFVVILAVCVALPAAAQSPSDSALVRALGPFQQGQPIRVALLRNRWAGEFRRVGGDTLFIGSRGDSAMAFRFNAVDTLWRQSSRSTRGAWIGGTTGALVVGFATAIVVGLGGAEGSSNLDDTAVAGGLLGAVAGGAIGALTGGLIGSRFRHWRRVYP